MVHTCVMEGCSSRANTKAQNDQESHNVDSNDIKFFSIPKVIQNQGEQTKDLSAERRVLWLARINRKDFNPTPSQIYYKVCSKHFISGNKAYLHDQTNPDWAPSIKLSSKDSSESPVLSSSVKCKRYKRACKKKFECFKCDYKCSSEGGMMKHTAIQHCSNNAQGLIEYHEGQGILTAEMNELEQCKSKVKKEFCSDGNYISETYHESELGINKIMFEHKDIKHEMIDHILPHHQHNEYASAHQSQNNQGLMPCKTELIDGGEEKYSDYDHGNVFTEHKDIKHEIIDHISPHRQHNEYASAHQSQNNQGLMPCKTEPIDEGEEKYSDYDHGNVFTEDGIICDKNYQISHENYVRIMTQAGTVISQTLPVPYIPRHIPTPSQSSCKFLQTSEIEVDNTGKYIPDGWQRKVLKFVKGPYANRKWIVKFILPCGRSFRSKSCLLEYLERLGENAIKDIDVDKLDFSPTSHNLMIKPKKGKNRVQKLEVKVDNTGIYIPEGRWQRKLFRYLTGCQKGKHVITYVSPSGKLLYHQGEMKEYLAVLEERGTPLVVDVERLSWAKPSNPWQGTHDKSFRQNITAQTELHNSRSPLSS